MIFDADQEAWLGPAYDELIEKYDDEGLADMAALFRDVHDRYGDEWDHTRHGAAMFGAVVAATSDKPVEESLEELGRDAARAREAYMQAQATLAGGLMWAARHHEMSPTELARAAGVTRTTVYRAVSP